MIIKHGKLLLLLFVAVTCQLTAQDPCTQLNYHAFKAESVAGSYTDLGILGSEIVVSEHDDGLSEPQEIGFVFEYMCQEFTQFIFSTNGFIKLGSEPLSDTDIFFSNSQSNDRGVFNSDTIADVNLIVAFNHDLDQGTNGHTFRMHTSGTAPDRVCTIQWEDQREWTSEPAKQFDNIDFQIKLYETTNVIELVYGEWEPSTNSSNYKSAAVGLKGLSNDDDQLLVVIKNSSAHWDNVTFANRNYAANESFNFGRPPERPAPDVGRTFRFTPTRSKDLTVQETYMLSEASYYYSSPQTIQASIRNSGYDTLRNIPVVLEILGSDFDHQQTQFIPSLAFGESAMVDFLPYQPRSSGPASVNVRVGTDDANADNTIEKIQIVDDFNLNYSTWDETDQKLGFLAGVQGIYYAKYPVHGTAELKFVNVFIADDSASIGKTVFAAVLDSHGLLMARSDNYVIQEANLKSWLSFGFSEPVVIRDSEFYAGFGMTSSLQDYAPLSVQKENPVRPETYYKSLVTGSGLTEVDPVEVPYRFMIAVTLAGTQPEVGYVYSDTTVCAGELVTISLEDYVGFFHWEKSPDGVNSWFSVTDVNGEEFGQSETFPINQSAYFRVKVTQPGFEPVYSDTIFIEVLAERPFITSSGDILFSSATEGNQWYDANGLIDGAIGETYFATEPGTYYTIVTQEGCVSEPSNAIELVSVNTAENKELDRIKIYPNPVRDELNIEMSDVMELELTIFDVTGRIVYANTIVEKNKVNVAWLNDGVYFIRFRIGDSFVVRRFVKE